MAIVINVREKVIHWQDKNYPEILLKFPGGTEIQVTEYNGTANVKLRSGEYLLFFLHSCATLTYSFNKSKFDSNFA